MASSRNGMADAIRTVLGAADDSLSAAEVIEQLVAQGHAFTEKNVRATLYQREVAGELIKGKRDQAVVYTLNPGFRRRGAVEPEPVPSFSGSLGVVCRPAAAAPASDSRADVLSVLDADIEYSLDDIAELLDGRYRKQQVRDALAELAHEGLVRSKVDADLITVYCSIEPTEDPAPAAIAEPTASPVVPPAAPPGRRLPLALGDRLDAIANDIEEAIADACDARLGHELIKALVLANGATHRALQKLAA